jgi:two-component system cell cycle response regulator CpdR
MPELDGITLAREAATLTPAPRVLFITGFATVALSAANGGARPETVLSKPFHLRDLVRAIDTVLAPAGAA